MTVDVPSQGIAVATFVPAAFSWGIPIVRMADARTSNCTPALDSAWYTVSQGRPPEDVWVRPNVSQGTARVVPVPRIDSHVADAVAWIATPGTAWRSSVVRNVGRRRAIPG